MAKVVYNACFGGFGLSALAVVGMADLGHEGAQAAIEAGGEGDNNALGRFGYDICRHDPILVQVVEELGPKLAGGDYAKLYVHELVGNRYVIDDYDGNETVVEPEDMTWVVVD